MALSFCFLLPLFAQETHTLTTYYPAPFGVYRELRSQRMIIGDNFINSDYAWDVSAANPIDQWADLVIEGDVGIGGIPGIIMNRGPSLGNLRMFGTQMRAGTDHDFSIYTNDPNSTGMDRQRLHFMSNGDVRIGAYLNNYDGRKGYLTIEGAETPFNGNEIAFLRFANDTYGTDNDPVIAQISSNLGFVAKSGDLRFHTRDGGALGLRMIINREGNVGIGTQSPSTGEQTLKLDVEGAIGASHYCDANGNNCATPPFGGSLTGCSVVNNAVNNVYQCTASCPTGKVLISGGCKIHDSFQVREQISASHPNSTGTGWVCAGYTGESSDTCTAYAYCCSQ